MLQFAAGFVSFCYALHYYYSCQRLSKPVLRFLLALKQISGRPREASNFYPAQPGTAYS